MTGTFVVGLTGGSGAPYALRLLEVLLEAGAEVHAIASEAGLRVLYHEAGIEMIKDAVADLDGVDVDVIDGLLVDYVRAKGAQVVLRGLRVLADFEYEFEMAMMNSHMYPDFETVYMMTSAKWFFVSSSRLREIASFGADVSEFVPKLVGQRLREKLAP